MKRRGRVAVLLVSILIAVGIAMAVTRELERRACRTYYVDLIGLDPGRATLDARKAIGRGDLHVVTVNGYGTEAPGVGGYWPAFTAVVGEQNLAGTSDVIRCKEHDRLNSRARLYAEAYNAEVLSQIARNGDKRTRDALEAAERWPAGGGDRAVRAAAAGKVR